MASEQGMNESLTVSYWPSKIPWILITLLWKLLVLILCAFLLSDALWLLYFALGWNWYSSFIAVGKAFGLQIRCGGLGSGVIPWESGNLEGSANSSCHFYSSLTDGYFPHSQWPLAIAILYGPHWKPLRRQHGEAGVRVEKHKDGCSQMPRHRIQLLQGCQGWVEKRSGHTKNRYQCELTWSYRNAL